MSESILERVQADTRDAMKAGERDRVATLRMIASSLQQDEKLGDGDAVAVLQRERKKRVEAAEAFGDAGRDEQAAAERAEAELIDGYLPEQISDEELGELIDGAIASTRRLLAEGHGQGDRRRHGAGQGQGGRQARLDRRQGAHAAVGA